MACVVAVGLAAPVSAADGKTRLVKDIAVGPASSGPTALTVNSAGVVFFWAKDRKHGWELWRSNGRARGTRLVRDIVPGRASSGANSSYHGMLVVGRRVYFLANRRPRDENPRLWVTDGTPAGTRLVEGIEYPPIPGLVYPRFARATGGTAYWSSIGAVWRLEGNRATPLRTAIEATGLTTIGSTLYFAGYDNEHGDELWRSDGTPGGTRPVLELGAGRSGNGGGGLIAADDKLFFSATASGGPRHLWTTDGTPGGTREVRDVGDRPLSGPSLDWQGFAYSDAATLGGEIYLAVSAPGEVWTLWRSDGTPGGTLPVHTARRVIRGVVAGRTGVYFTVGNELWVTTGTPDGTRRVRGVPGYTMEGTTLTTFGDRWFACGAFGAWSSDGTRRGTRRDSRGCDGYGGLAVSRGRVFFASGDRSHGAELWIASLKRKAEAR